MNAFVVGYNPVATPCLPITIATLGEWLTRFYEKITLSPSASIAIFCATADDFAEPHWS